MRLSLRLAPSPHPVIIRVEDEAHAGDLTVECSMLTTPSRMNIEVPNENETVSVDPPPRPLSAERSPGYGLSTTLAMGRGILPHL